MDGLLFIGLNLADASLTGELIALGCGEANSIVSAYGNSLIIKGLLSFAAVTVVVAIGKAKLLKLLNVCMLVVVIWNGGWLLTYL
ncbi:unnamed protein product, partial [marine sediment metagenome]